MTKALKKLVPYGAIVWLLVAVSARDAAAQIPIDRVQILNSPDVRGWEPTATITKVEFWRGAGIHFEFDRNATWPDVVPEGWNGPIQYTVWILLRDDSHGGQWNGSGIIECWRDRQSTDDADVTENNQIARNWLYDGRWGPMQGHQPQPGERVGFMLTDGDARGKDVHGVTERSRIVEIAWPAASDGAVAFLWVEPSPTSVISVPPPAPPAPPALPAPPTLPAQDLSPVLAQLAILTSKVDALAQSESAFHAQVADAWQRTGGVVLKYVLPAIGAVLAGRATK